jgi:hypothetical protein
VVTSGLVLPTAQVPGGSPWLRGPRFLEFGAVVEGPTLSSLSVLGASRSKQQMTDQGGCPLRRGHCLSGVAGCTGRKKPKRGAALGDLPTQLPPSVTGAHVESKACGTMWKAWRAWILSSVSGMPTCHLCPEGQGAWSHTKYYLDDTLSPGANVPWV